MTAVIMAPCLNVAPHKITFKQGAMITAVIGIVMMPWRLYNDAAAYIFTWLIGYGALLGPIAGIMIADYFLLRKREIVVDDLFRRGGRYEYWGGINWIAITAFVLGVLPNLPGFLGAIGAGSPSPFFAHLYDWAWFVGVAVSGITYLVGMKTLAPSGNLAAV